MNGKALSALLKVKLSGLISGILNALKSKGKKGGAIKKVLYGIFMLFAFVMLFFYFGLLFFQLCEPFCESGIRWFYFALAGASSLLMCFVGSIFTTQAYIYKAGDNDLLMSMPIKPAYILISRVASILAIDYFYALMVLLPAGVVYLIYYTPSALGVVMYVLCVLLFPLLSQALASLVAWLLEIITARIKNKNLFTTVTSFATLALYFIVVFSLTDYINTLMTNGVAVANAVKEGFFPIYYLGTAISEHDFTALAIIAVVCIVPFAISYALLSKNFLKLVSMKRTEAKKEYVEKKLNVRSPMMAILLKDLKKFISTPTFMLNSGLGGIFAIAASVFLPSRIGDAIDAIESLGFGIDIELILAVLAAGVLSVCAGMNFVSAPLISLEAKTLWTIKTVPVHPKEILIGKALVHVVVTAPFMVIGAAISCVSLGISGMNAALVFALPLVYTLFGGLFGVFMNLQLPKFDWTSEARVIKQSASVMTTMLVSFVSLILLLVLFVVLMVEFEFYELGVYIWAVTGFFAVCDVLIYVYLCTAGSRKFNDLSA